MNPNAMRGTIIVAVMVLLGAVVLGFTNRTGVPAAVADVTVVEEEVVEEPTLATEPGVVEPVVTATPAADFAHSPSEVRVQVANGSGIAGVAGQMTQRLAGNSYQMAEATNATNVQASTVFYKPGYDADAIAVLNVFSQPDVPTAPMPDVPEGIEGFDPTVQILIVVGPDDLSTS